MSIIPVPNCAQSSEICGGKTMKKPSLFAVILYALCAVIWSVRVMFEVIYSSYYNSVFLFVLNILCALIWIAAFIVNLKRYRSNKEN